MKTNVKNNGGSTFKEIVRDWDARKSNKPAHLDSKETAMCNTGSNCFYPGTKIMKSAIFLFGIAIILIACKTHSATLEELKDKNYQMSYDAMRRGAVLSINKEGKIVRILSEVQPDAAIATTREITTKLMANLQKGNSVTGENMTKITETLSKLGERTAPVNMLRDALYRMEEHCINFPEHCPKELYWKSFDSVVTSVTRLQKQISDLGASEAVQAKSEAERTKNEAEKVKNEAELLRIETFKKLNIEGKAELEKMLHQIK